MIKNERLQIDRYEFLDLCTGIKKEHELIDAIDPVLIDNPQNIKNTIKKERIKVMKFKEIFKMVVRCFCKEKSERCEGCRLEQAAKSLPNGIEESAIALVEDVLEPTSEVYGKPIGVLNGFCCPVRLRLMGESLQSAHVRGEAADICALVTDGEDLGLENLELARAVMEVGFYDVLVLGDVEPGSIKPKWIKVCWKRNGNNMGMVLKKEAGKAEVEQLSKKEMKELTKG